MNLYQITSWSHALIRLQVPEEGLYIDATMGNGHDTLFLCQMAGEKGKVLAFDIQEQAFDSYRPASQRTSAKRPGQSVSGKSCIHGQICTAGVSRWDLL